MLCCCKTKDCHVLTLQQSHYAEKAFRAVFQTSLTFVHAQNGLSTILLHILIGVYADVKSLAKEESQNQTFLFLEVSGSSQTFQVVVHEQYLQYSVSQLPTGSRSKLRRAKEAMDARVRVIEYHTRKEQVDIRMHICRYMHIGSALRGIYGSTDCDIRPRRSWPYLKIHICTRNSRAGLHHV